MILATGLRVPPQPDLSGMKLDRFQIHSETVCPSIRAEYGAQEWVMARHAPPHMDYADLPRFLLTLSCTDGWSFGDALWSRRTKRSGADVPAGTLFVVDIRECHWLVPRDIKPMPDDAVWCGLQWFCNTGRELTRRSRELVDRIGGTWAELTDARYRRIKP